MRPLTPRKVLLPTDFSPNAAFADPYAVALARSAGAEIILITVVDVRRDHVGPGPDDPHLGPAKVSPAYPLHRDEIIQEARLALAEWPVRASEGIALRREVVENSNPATGIVEFARREGIDVIVLASHGRGLLGQLFLGSVARDVMGRAECPVLCVKRAEAGLVDSKSGRLVVREVAVAADDSASALRAFEFASEIATEHDARLHLLYVPVHEIPATVFAPDGEPILPIDDVTLRIARERREAFERVVASWSAHAKIALLPGSEEKDVATYAAQHGADVVVMSRHGLGDAVSFLGGAPVRLLHEVRCPLLLV